MNISEIAIRWVMFLINPFIAMIFSFQEYMRPYAKNIFWAFCTFYGLTFAIGTESFGSDINRYVAELDELYSQPLLTIKDGINYFKNSGEIDVLRTLISYTLSRLTNSQSVLTMVYALIFGYFFSRNIWYVLNLLKNRISILSKLLILTLILIMPIWQIGGFRMWTAFHLFIYGLLPFIIENKKSRLLFLYASFLVHFSFLLPIGIFIIYRIVGDRTSIYFILFVISLFISEINISAINSFFINYLPDILIERSSGYFIDAEVEGVRQAKEDSLLNWYAIWYTRVLSWSLIIILIYLYVFRLNLLKLRRLNGLFSLILLMYTFANILVNIPSGSRFLNFPFFLSLVLIISYLDYFLKDIDFRSIIKILSPAFIFFCLVVIRKGFYYTSVTTIIGNPFIAILNIDHFMSLNDLIK